MVGKLLRSFDFYKQQRNVYIVNYGWRNGAKFTKFIFSHI